MTKIVPKAEGRGEEIIILGLVIVGLYFLKKYLKKEEEEK